MKTRVNWPFRINAWVLLSGPLHCTWSLPEGDSDFSTRWNLIKRRASKALKGAHYNAMMDGLKRSRRELTFWQRQYWEHRIRGDRDYERHCDYIHYNPVKHDD